MMIQTLAQNGDVLLYDLREPRQEVGSFGLLATDRNTEQRARLHLTSEQAADLLESLITLGVRVTDRAQAALDRSA